MSGVAHWLREHRHHLRKLPAVVAAFALLVLMVRNADLPALPSHEVPEGFVPAPPPTTALPGGAQPALPGVPGTTSTTVPPNVGRARLSGVVGGPQGAVPGAVVRLERVVGDATQVLDVVTGPDGRYDAPGIGGGRYRVRAFLPPTLAQATGDVIFLTDGEERTIDLTVEEFAEPTIRVAFAPDPPLLGSAVNLGVRVTGRLVDVDGFVRTQPLVGGTVEVTFTGGWGTPSPSSTTTDTDGQARFSSFCQSTTPTQVQVSVRLPAALPGTVPTTASFDVPACVDPATLTTTTTTTIPEETTATTTPETTATTTAP